jgi:putative heme-binding domain-containing protein
MAKGVIALLDPLYPARTELLNREFCRVLVYLQSPDVVAKSMKLLAAAPTQEEQIHYVAMLRMAKVGWTPELQRKYFEWFNMARKYTGGNSFKGFLQNIRTDAIAALSDDEKASLKEVLAAPAPQIDDRPVLPHKFVRDWKMEDLNASLSQLDRGRSFEKGEAAYAAVQCVTCHSFRVQSAAIGLGPDLTGVGNRFNANDLLDSIILPSKVISDQYQNIDIRTKDGDAFSGKIESEDADKIVLKTNPIAKATIIQKKNVKSRAPSKISSMPQGLLNILSEEEILDLLAYLRSGGDPSDKAFKK